MPSGDSPRILVVDDERLARKRVTDLILAARPNATIAEAPHGRAALEALDGGSFDVMMLDVEMPGMTAFELVRAMDAVTSTHGRPAIVMVTAFDQYALDAFDAGAVDYVLKPIDPSRLERGLVRALQRRANEAAAGVDRLDAAVKAASGPFLERIAVRLAGRIEVVQIEDLEWIEARGSYVVLHGLGGDGHLYRSSLKALAADLDPERFQRVHRSALVCVDAIKTVTPAGHGDARIELVSGRCLTLGRRYREEVLSALDRRGG